MVGIDLLYNRWHDQSPGGIKMIELLREIDDALTDARFLLDLLKQKMVPEEWDQEDENTRLKLEVIHGKVLAAMAEQE